MIHGIINIYKEPGFTSFDVVAKLRGILKQKKIGHTGTLDPAAEGVLPVCLGNGTKLCDVLTDRTKEYEAVLLLGVTTDTLDMTGTVLKTAEVTCNTKQVEETIFSFLGTYEQVPPMYSALKVEGKRLYEFAREGKEIERKSRPVTIHKLEIKDMDLPRVRFTVECSKGTYIRSLCQDIGERLGCGGAMEHLIRIRSGRFTIENAHRLSEIERMRDADCLSEVIVPLEEVLAEYPAFQVKQEYKKFIDNGNPLPKVAFVSRECGSFEEPAFEKEYEKIRVYNTEGRFFAIYVWKEEKCCFMPDKIFPEEKV